MVSGARVAKGGRGDAGTSLRHTIGFWRKDDRNRKTTFIRGYCLKLFSNTDKVQYVLPILVYENLYTRKHGHDSVVLSQ